MSGDFGQEFRNLQRMMNAGSPLGTELFPDVFPQNLELDVGSYFITIRDEAHALGHSAPAIAPPQGIIFPAVAQALIESIEGRVNARMGSNAPLVVVGGQYQGSLRVSPGAPACAFVGPRNGSGELMSVHLALEEPGVTGYAEVFCLPVDQRFRA